MSQSHQAWRATTGGPSLAGNPAGMPALQSFEDLFRRTAVRILIGRVS